MEFRRIVTRGPVTVDFLDGAGPDLVISCASVGHDASRAPSPEFVATAIGKGTPAFPRRALFVSDASRSWANAPELAPALRAALDIVTAIAPVHHIGTLGLSMGGFAALAACHVVPVNVALAFGPQFSVLPSFAPEEIRWAEWTGQVSGAIMPQAPLPPAGSWAVVCHGLLDDLPQAQRFGRADNLDHIYFPDRNHADLVPWLKQRGVLAGMMEAAMSGDRVRLLRIASSAGGRLRHRVEAAFQ